MVLQIELVRRILRFLSRRETTLPLEQQPIDILDDVVHDPEVATRIWRDQRRLRHGPMPEYRYIWGPRGQPPVGVFRRMDYIGTRPQDTHVLSWKQLRFEATLVGEDGKRYEVVGSLSTGEQWTAARQQRQLASGLKRVDPDIEKPSLYVRKATVAIDWYLTTYETFPVSDDI